MENPTKDGYAFKATSIDSDISCNDYLCLLNNVLLIGTFPVLIPNNTGKMKKKMITLIKSMKKDLQIKLYFEKKNHKWQKTIPGTETIVTSSGFVYIVFFFYQRREFWSLPDGAPSIHWGSCYITLFLTVGRRGREK